MDIKREVENGCVYLVVSEKQKKLKIELSLYMGKEDFPERILAEVEDNYLRVLLPEGNSGLKALQKFTDKVISKQTDLKVQDIRLFGSAGLIHSMIEIKDGKLLYNFEPFCAGIDGEIKADFGYKSEKDFIKIVEVISKWETQKLVPLFYMVHNNYICDGENFSSYEQ